MFSIFGKINSKIMKLDIVKSIRSGLQKIIFVRKTTMFAIIVVISYTELYSQLAIDASTTPNTGGVVLYSTLSGPDKAIAVSLGIIVKKGGHLDIDEDITWNSTNRSHGIEVEVGNGTLPGGGFRNTRNLERHKYCKWWYVWPNYS